MTLGVTEKELMIFLNEAPGSSSEEVAKFFDITQSVANRRLLSLLTDQKVVRRNIKLAGIKGVQWGYWSPDCPNIPNHTVVPNIRPGSRYSRKPEATPAGYEATIFDLRNQIHTLEEWKAEALRRYPDLAVSELTLKARRIVQQTNPGHAPFKDDSPIMLAVIAALEENQ